MFGSEDRKHEDVVFAFPDSKLQELERLLVTMCVSLGLRGGKRCFMKSHMGATDTHTHTLKANL